MSACMQRSPSVITSTVKSCLMVAALAGLTAGASGTAFAWSYKEAAEPYSGTTIRILDEVTPLQETMVDLVHEFEEETGINVDVELLNHYDVIRRGEADVLTGRAFYDAIMVHSNQLGTIFQAGVARPIDEFIADPSLTNPNLDLDDLIQPGWDAGSKFRGETYSFLTWNYISVLGTRSDLLEHPDEQSAFQEQYGYELSPAETMQQMRDIAEFFTRSRGEQLAGETLTRDFYGIVMEGMRTEMLFEGVYANYIKNWGGQLFDEEGRPTFDLAENVDALQFWADLWQFSPPGQAEYSVIDVPTVMGNGIAAQAILYADFMLGIDRSGAAPYAGSFTYTAIPRNDEQDGNRSAYGLPSSLIISKHSGNPEPTYLFLQWLIEKTTQDMFIETQGTWVPVRESSWNHPLLTDSPHAEAGLYAAMGESMNHNFGSPIIPQWFEILDRVGALVQEVALGRKTAEEGMRDAQDEVLAICTECVLLQD